MNRHSYLKNLIISEQNCWKLDGEDFRKQSKDEEISGFLNDNLRKNSQAEKNL